MKLPSLRIDQSTTTNFPALTKAVAGSRRRHGVAALAIAGLLGITLTGKADPLPTNPPGYTVPPVFCFRITDVERVPGDVTGKAFIFEFETLNWTGSAARGLRMMSNIGTSVIAGTVPTITSFGIDPNGRGGPLGGNDIGAGRFDGDGLTPGPLSPSLGAIHNGRGRGDIAGNLNDWSAGSVPGTAAGRVAFWTAGSSGTSIPSRNLLGVSTQSQVNALVPGDALLEPFDARGDSAIDGGPGLTIDGVTPDGSGNVLDGFTLEISDFDLGETISLNWFELGSSGQALGRVQGGNQFGYGIVNLARIPLGGPLPGPVFAGNTGFKQGSTEFFDSVYAVPNPSEFAVEFGGGITASFLNPGDNTVFAQVNRTTTVPEPSAFVLAGLGATVACGFRKRRIRKP